MKKGFFVRLEYSQIQELNEMSRLIGKKVSQIVRRAIDEYLKNKKKSIYNL